MNSTKLIVTYATRLARRQWRRFLLPFFSLTITAIVLSLTLLLTSAGNNLLTEQARELLGGDVVIESTEPLALDTILESLQTPPVRVSSQMSFSATIESEADATTVSMRVVDRAFPIYGEARTSTGPYRHPEPDEIILDEASATQLAVEVGDTVRFGQVPYTVSAILIAEPTSLIGSFRFLPRVLIGTEGFVRSEIDPTLLRAEYEYALLAPALASGEKERLREFASESNGRYQVSIAEDGQGGLQTGLRLVRDFLVVAVLITAVLATVNVYASTVYLVSIERKSFAIMLSLGLTGRRLLALIGVALSYVVVLATLTGTLLGHVLFGSVRSLANDRLLIALPEPQYAAAYLVTAVFLFLVALSAFAPTLRHLASLQPKQVLAGDIGATTRSNTRLVVLITSITLAPLLVASVWLLGSITQGIVTVVGVGSAYVGIALLFSLLLALLYRKRALFSFRLRSIIAHKREDGLFGIISFTSLFVALTALSTLVMLQVSLERYLTNDLSTTVPSTYVIDVQPSQREGLLSRFPELTLFSNTPARVLAIDELRIQDELSAGSEGVDRELGREFNITARDYLLVSETITAGDVWTGTKGELSVDEAFAERAGIELGSRIEFSVQGFLVEGIVTSLRQTDSRSGLPFFYFVLSPQDLESFPMVYFGYAYHDETRQDDLSRYVANAMPNVSVLETQTLAPLVRTVTRLLLLLVLIVAIPPLLIAVLLVVTLIISSYDTRRLEGARMRALGATKRQMLVQYVLETITLTLSASVLAYVFGVAVAYGVSLYFFDLDRAVLYDPELALSLLGVVALVLLLSLYLFKTDTIQLRELLSYGDH